MKLVIHANLMLASFLGLIVMARASEVDMATVVGISSSHVHKGRNAIQVQFAGVGDDEPKLRDILHGACDGDVLSFGDFTATAALVDGQIHWVADGEIVDDMKMPEQGSLITIDRTQEKNTTITFAGSATYPKAVRSQNSSPQDPDSRTIKPVERPEMYIADYLSYSTIRIQSRTTTGGSTGTGFFYICRVKDNPQITIPVIITNWHVVSNAVETSLIFTQAEARRPSDKKVGYVTQYPMWERWIRHPSNNVDLAALPLLPVINMVKAQTGRDVFYMPFDASMIPDERTFNTITQLDEVAMVGYPNGYCDEFNNQPIFRKGAIATRPSLSYLGSREYLVDMSVFPGSSGSPILLVSEGTYFDRSKKATAFGNRLMLLGVNRAVHTNRVFHEDEVRRTNAGDPNYYQPNNLGVVIHPSRLKELESFISQLYLSNGR